MDIKLKFLGAARNVTGSRYCLEANNSRILVDCGLYQERELRSRNWEPFLVSPDTIDGVLLTHAHLDQGNGMSAKVERADFPRFHFILLMMPRLRYLRFHRFVMKSRLNWARESKLHFMMQAMCLAPQ